MKVYEFTEVEAMAEVVINEKLDYQRLAEDVVYAVQCGKAVEEAMDNDDGTCNLDFCLIKLPPRTRRDTLHKALAAVESREKVSVHMGKSFRFKNYFAIYPDTDCQANARNANVEEIVKVLTERGWDCMVFYLMD